MSARPGLTDSGVLPVRPKHPGSRGCTDGPVIACCAAMTSKLRVRALLLAFLALLLTSVPARADALLTFSFAAVNFTENPQLFTFTFSTSYALGPYDTLNSEFSTTVSDLDGNGGVGVGPADASGFMMVPEIDGSPVGAASLGTGCTPIGAPGFVDEPCDVFSTASVIVSTLASGNFGAIVSFFLSGGDSITGEGQLELTNTQVPEPVSMVLLGLGVSVAA